ncbi:MAG TPA: hypothetical protein VF169_10390 [Albitalea sp.]|uniref:hypothetical protein n=1 Tax=Piscinibacter sp. TaxID=1903157 RepID=UPI002ED439E3
MSRSFVLSAVCAATLSLIAGSVLATESAKPAKKPAKTEAKAAAPATAATTEQVSQNQLDIASRVLTGDARCEFDQKVSVHAIDGKPGHFKVGFKNATYTMVPQETTTGAVRLEDKHNGIVWIQIPSKSMLLNGKIGQRLVDGCTQTQQRASL